MKPTTTESGRLQMPSEELWRRVRRWARRRKLEYVPTYGIVGVAPT